MISGFDSCRMYTQPDDTNSRKVIIRVSYKLQTVISAISHKLSG